MTMTATDKIKLIQEIIGVTADGKFGPKSRAALDALLQPERMTAGLSAEHHVKASSFADPADVAAYKKAKARGASDQQAFRVGDNGIGCWGDSTAEGSGPSCALPPEDMEERWGSVAGAKHKLVEVSANGKSITCVLKDRMPRRKNIKNAAGIDLNPDAVRLLGLEPPIMISAIWRWV